MDKIYVFPHSKSRLLLNITHISVVKTSCFEFKLLTIKNIFLRHQQKSQMLY